ncbi:MAG: PTS sugar transporter subunit IIA [Tepidanaerobacteraceae bacterium]|jgi:mannose/fructose/sorbose-specific phosphotransferase system IIA component|nr:PTS sugar transporter subunit IIA [Tepidanaerobacteraceae bacterium]
MKVILVGHGAFPAGLLRAAKMISGENDFLKIMSFDEDDDLEGFESKLKKEIGDAGEDVLILADLFGGSPFNMAMKLSSRHSKSKMRVVSGTNLPMVLELCSVINNGWDMDKLASHLISIGKESIVEGFRHLGLANGTE